MAIATALSWPSVALWPDILNVEDERPPADGHLLAVDLGPVAELVTDGCRSIEDLLLAAKIEIGITYSARVDEARILALTRSMMAVEFRATTVHAPYVDPIAVLFLRPFWVRNPTATEYGLSTYRRGNIYMLNGRATEAPGLFSMASGDVSLRRPHESFLFRKCVATSIGLAVTHVEQTGGGVWR